MVLDPILRERRLSAAAERSFWPNRRITDYLDDAVRATPEKLAVLGSNAMTGASERLSFRELKDISDRLALALHDLGVRRGDVVSFQLPNWWQFTALHLAAVRLGAATNPLMPIFRERELSFMLALAESKIMVVPKQFRGFDHEAMMERLRPQLPKLESVFIVGGGGETAFETLLQRRSSLSAEQAKAIFAAGSPDDVAQLLYTSGTTGEPKGAMQSSNTLLSNVLEYARRLHLTHDDVLLMGSPMAHQTGFMYGMMLSLVLGATNVLMDVWNAEAAVELIAKHKATFTMGSTPFLADLAGAPGLKTEDISSFKIFVAGGAPIPRILARQAADALDAKILSCWGMTECGVATLTPPEAPPEKAYTTDGVGMAGMEVAIFGSDGQKLGAGREGLLKVRGAGSFLGYLKRPELYHVDDEGWFDTGDIARIDADGYIAITGRAKDIIIRGGENIPVAEVEQALYRCPGVVDAAVVAMPDERLGERGCAFVKLREGASMTLAEMRAHLEAQGMARPYFPERLEVVAEMPRTPSGKIQKFKLREIASRFGNEV